MRAIKDVFLLKQRIARDISAKFFVRFHMTLILATCIFSGLLTTKLLLISGVKSMLIRYPIAVVGAYLMFFLGVRVWLWYINVTRASASFKSSLDVTDGVNFDVPTFNGRGITSGVEFGGGHSGGAGATGSFDGLSTDHSDLTGGIDLSNGSGDTAASGVGHVLGAVADTDEGGIILLVVGILLAIFLAAIFGVGAYLIYQAPNILSEAAFDFVLAGSLIKRSRMMDDPDWTGSVFRATVVPFAVILLLSVALSWTIIEYLPECTKMHDVVVKINQKMNDEKR